MTPSQLDQIAKGLCCWGRCQSPPEAPSKYCRLHIDASTAASVRAQERKKVPQPPCARCGADRPAAMPGAKSKLCQPCGARVHNVSNRRDGWPKRRGT